MSTGLFDLVIKLYKLYFIDNETKQFDINIVLVILSK